MGLGDVQGPLSPDEQAAYQAGVINAAGGAIPSGVDLTSETNQALFNAGYNAGTSGGPATGTLSALTTLGFPASPVPSTTSGGSTPSGTSFTAWLQANQQMVLLVGAGLLGVALLSGMGRR